MNKNIGQISDNLMYREADIYAQRLYSESNHFIQPKDEFDSDNINISERRPFNGHQSGPKLIRGNI